MSVKIGKSRRHRRTIAELMLSILGIALTLAIVRSVEALLRLGFLIALVLASALTYKLVCTMNRGLLESRNRGSPFAGHAVKVALLVVCGLSIFVVTFVVEVALLIALALTVAGLQGNFL